MIRLSLPDAAIELIKAFEGFSPTPYHDVAGHATIGYGHLILAGETFTSISKEHATRLLRQDIIIAEHAVLRLIHAPLHQNQYGALVSFTFNLGGGALQRSTLRMKLNREEYDLAANELLRWVYAGGRKYRGLLRRRQAERQLFLTDN